MNQRTGDKSATRGPALFKSKKELVMLAVSATVFAVVIYTMYLSKGSEERLGAAEPHEDVAAAPVPADDAAGAPGDPPDARPGRDLLDRVDFENLETEPELLPPPWPDRDPFVPAGPLKKHLARSRTPGDDPETEPAAEPVVVTPDNLKETLARIPGAEKAAGAGFRLGAVMRTGGWHGATINGRVLQVGDRVLGFTLDTVRADGVILRRGRHRIKLPMRPGALRRSR
ncbi:MAG: hypothetical protein ACOC8E_01290 [Planctomycetota bacterium]